MKIVVDTNILFSFFWKESITRKIIINLKGSLISPIKSKEELKKYSKEIISKLKINQKEFDEELINLENYIDFIEKEKYVDFIEKINNLNLDKNDFDFLALAYKNKYLLWTNDSVLKNQNIIKIITTKELLED